MPDLFTIIHTDGGCSPNPGEGAYVAVLQNGGKSACVRGYTPHATNQQMELAAAISALKVLKSSRIPVKIFTDSQYLQKGASLWLRSWKRNDWTTSKGDPVMNLDLWKELDELIGQYVISWHKVEGHAGVEMNVRADALVWDTRHAKGNSPLYRVTDIPEITCPWNFTQFNTQINPTIEPEIAYLRERMARPTPERKITMFTQNVLYLYPEEYPSEWHVFKVSHTQSQSRIWLRSNLIPGNFPDSNFCFELDLTVLALCGTPTVSNTAWSSLRLAGHIILSDQCFDDIKFAEDGPGPNFYPDKTLLLRYFKEASGDYQYLVQ